MTENEITEILLRENEEFRTLTAEHRDLKEKIAESNKRVYHSPEEEAERKSLQKMKLQKKDRLAEIIKSYKVEHSIN